MNEAQNAERIQKLARLNDDFRKTFIGGRLLMTAGVAALDRQTRLNVMRTVQKFDSFTKDNDPYGEHDFGFFKIDHQGFFWKIDYYDPTLRRHSDDASDPTLTIRVMTVMLTEEY